VLQRLLECLDVMVDTAVTMMRSLHDVMSCQAHDRGLAGNAGSRVHHMKRCTRMMHVISEVW